MSAQPQPMTGRTSTSGERMRSPGRYQTYRPERPWAWWNRNQRYKVYMVRELSAVFCAIWAVNQIRQLKRLGKGERAYEQYVRSRRNPGWVVLNAIGSAFMILHAVTWWRLLGGLDLVKLGDRKVSPEKVTAGAFGAWGAVNLIFGLIMLFGGRRRG